MLEFGQKQDAVPDDLIKDGSEASFMQDVIEMSKEIPVIVDFWAPWCGPCKTLGPMLEDAVKAAGGKVRMVKINVDEAQQISTQLKIQSIPTVYGYYQGQPIDAFQGAQPESEIKTFIDKLIALAGDGGLSEAIKAAEQMLTEGAAVDAAQTFAAILGETPNNAAAYGGMVRAHIVMDDLDQAESILNGAPEEISNTPELDAARAQLHLARQAADAGPITELQTTVDEQPDNHQARLDLAKALHAAGQVENAVDELMELFRRDRDWQDGAAKSQLFTIFDALTAQDPIALNGRRKLSSLIFV
ncbi:MAG: thioredoxin [Paracoccaceae bacterium]